MIGKFMRRLIYINKKVGEWLYIAETSVIAREIKKRLKDKIKRYYYFYLSLPKELYKVFEWSINDRIIIAINKEKPYYVLLINQTLKKEYEKQSKE